MDYRKLFSQIDAMKDAAIANRRDFHKYAESGWLEFRTTAKIAAQLEEAGMPFKMGKEIINTEYVMGRPSEETVAQNQRRAIEQGADPKYVEATEGYTGVMAMIDSGKPGPVIALRFDIDSNDCNEKMDAGHRPAREGFASVNSGFQHACGHDGHATIGLLCAKALYANKDSLTGKVKIFFQPAEEGVRGAKAMVESGRFDDVDYLLTGHIGFGAQKDGKLIANTVGMLATTKVDATFTGRSAHAGAYPQEGKNALLAAAAAALSIHTQCQDGRGAARVNVGVMNAGAGRNVVPEKAVLKLETRGYTTEINEDLYRKVMKVLQGAADMYDVKLETSLAGGAACAVGDKEMQDLICQTAKELHLADEIQEIYDLGASEDASFMMSAVQSHGGKACYMMWGTPITAPHHNSAFDFNEDVLTTAAKTVCACVGKIAAK